MSKEAFTQNQIINTIVEQMIADKGETLTDELRAALNQQMTSYIEGSIFAALPDEKLLELDAMAERDASDEELDAFFDQAGVDYDRVAEDAIARFREAYLNGTLPELLAEMVEPEAGEAEMSEVAAETDGVEASTAEVDGVESANAGASEAGAGETETSEVA